MNPVAFAMIRTAMDRQGIPFKEVGSYNLNLVGIRAAASERYNRFDDTLAILYYQQSRPCMTTMRMTTDPGRHYLEKPLTEAGTAILKPGHYPAMWSLGLHRGLYPGLIQTGNTTVLRDRNVDGTPNLRDVPQQSGHFGINCHRAAEGYRPEFVDRWSAGCQVIPDSLDFDVLMALTRRAASVWGETFDYTLLTEEQLWIL